MKYSRVQAVSHHFRYLLIIEAGMAVIMNIAIVLGTGILTDLIDQFLQNGVANISLVLLPTLVCMVVGTATAILQRYYAGKYSIETGKELNRISIEKLSRIRQSYYDKEGPAKLETRLVSDLNELEKYYESTIPELVNNTIAIVLVLIYIGWKNIWLMTASLCLYPIVLGIIYFFGKRLKKLANQRRGKIDVMVERVSDSLEGIEVIRSYHLYEYFVQSIENAITDILDNEYVRAWITHFSQTVNRLLFWIPNMAAPCLALFLVLHGNMSVGGMTAYIVLVHKIMGRIKDVPFLLNERKEQQASVERIDNLLDAPEERNHRSVSDDNYSVNEAEIAFEHVSFAYEEQTKEGLATEGRADVERVYEGQTKEEQTKEGRMAVERGNKNNEVLHDLSFQVQKGEFVAIVGESGQGKSTIFRLLSGLYENGKGQINYQGQSLKELGSANARTRIAVVEQAPFLFEGTIYENVAAGREHANMESVVQAAKMAGIHARIMELPEKYDTILGENGAGLSGGEKQRIAIARALIKDAPILLMDEPTSSVDMVTEKMICESVSRLRGIKTIIMIAHRLNTIVNADRILVISHGSILESGTQEALLQYNGKYKELYELEHFQQKNSQPKDCRQEVHHEAK